MIRSIKNIQEKIKTFLYCENEKNINFCPIESTKLVYMLEFSSHLTNNTTLTNDNIYSILMEYEKNNSLISKLEHEKCKCECLEYFEKKNEQINNNITDHFEKLNTLIDKSYDNIFVSNNFSGEKKFYINHRIIMDMINRKGFQLNSSSLLLFETKKEICTIDTSAQYNSLNYEKILFKNLIKTILIKYASEDNHHFDKYNNKTIYNAIITLEDNKPKITNFDDILSDKDNVKKIINIIKNCIKNKLNKHDTYLQYLCKIDPKKFYDKITNNKSSYLKKIADNLNDSMFLRNPYNFIKDDFEKFKKVQEESKQYCIDKTFEDIIYTLEYEDNDIPTLEDNN